MNFLNFAIVLVSAIVISAAVAGLYANGVRMLAVGQTDESGVHHMKSRIGASICFGACIVIVLFALWLIVPIFH